MREALEAPIVHRVHAQHNSLHYLTNICSTRVCVDCVDGALDFGRFGEGDLAIDTTLLHGGDDDCEFVWGEGGVGFGRGQKCVGGWQLNDASRAAESHGL